MRSRYACASTSRLGSRSHTCSRPRRVLRTRPASASTRRCLVIAWRDTADFALSCVIDPGPPDDNRRISPRRVSSPRAAKSGAASRTGDLAEALGLDMAANVLHLLSPALLVHAEGFGATSERHTVEA